MEAKNQNSGKERKSGNPKGVYKMHADVNEPLHDVKDYLFENVNRALVEGEKSGISKNFDSTEHVNKMKKKLDKKKG